MKSSLFLMNKNANKGVKRAGRRRAIRFFLLFALWLFVGTMFYAYEPHSNLGLVMGFFMAINIGYSIGFGFPTEDHYTNMLFSSCYVIVGASFVAMALSFFAEKISQDRDNWFTNLMQKQNYEEAMKKGTSLRKKAKAVFIHYSSVIRTVSLWVVWIISMTIYGRVQVKEWNWTQAQYFAISTCSTGGHYGIPKGAPEWLFGLTAVMMMLGVPVMAVAMASVSQLITVSGDIDATKERICEEVDIKELVMLQEFGLEDGDGIIDRAEFIILCMVRIGTDPNLIEFISDRFAELDDDDSGGLSILEITCGNYEYVDGLIMPTETFTRTRGRTSVYEWKMDEAFLEDAFEEEEEEQPKKGLKDKFKRNKKKKGDGRRVSIFDWKKDKANENSHKFDHSHNFSSHLFGGGSHMFNNSHNVLNNSHNFNNSYSHNSGAFGQNSERSHIPNRQERGKGRARASGKQKRMSILDWKKENAAQLQMLKEHSEESNRSHTVNPPARQKRKSLIIPKQSLQELESENPNIVRSLDELKEHFEKQQHKDHFDGKVPDADDIEAAIFSNGARRSQVKDFPGLNSGNSQPPKPRRQSLTMPRKSLKDWKKENASQARSWSGLPDAKKTTFDKKPFQIATEGKPSQITTDDKPFQADIDDKPFQADIDDKPVQINIHDKPFQTNTNDKPFQKITDDKPFQITTADEPFNDLLDGDIDSKLFSNGVRRSQIQDFPGLDTVGIQNRMNGHKEGPSGERKSISFLYNEDSESSFTKGDTIDDEGTPYEKKSNKIQAGAPSTFFNNETSQPLRGGNTYQDNLQKSPYNPKTGIQNNPQTTYRNNPQTSQYTQQSFQNNGQTRNENTQMAQGNAQTLGGNMHVSRKNS